MKPLVQPRPVQKFDVFCFHLKILGEQRLDLGDIQYLVVPLIQFDDTAVFIRDVRLV